MGVTMGDISARLGEWTAAAAPGALLEPVVAVAMVAWGVVILGVGVRAFQHRHGR